jgi:hypothetical protein
MAENEDNTTVTLEKARRQTISPRDARFSRGRSSGAENIMPTIFLGHICVCNPRLLILRDTK